jgi:hypothetical protein
MIERSATKDADYYGYALIGIGGHDNPDYAGAGGFRLEFPADGVVNAANPTPCSADDSQDQPFIAAIFELIAQSGNMDSTQTYLQGFSQNSMFAAYIAVCFADRVAGVWQGGSGLARTGFLPITPGLQAQVSLSNSLAGSKTFCEECSFWPIWPRTCEHKIVDCVFSYEDDAIGCGSDKLMYDALIEEGNDARLLSFPGGSHTNPKKFVDCWVFGNCGCVF